MFRIKEIQDSLFNKIVKKIQFNSHINIQRNTN